MIQYLIILLDNTSTSYCQYENSTTEKKLISIANLKKAIFYGMTENLMIQFVYPDYELPSEYNELIESIDHVKIKPSTYCKNANVVVFNDWKELMAFPWENNVTYVLRVSKEDLFAQYHVVKNCLSKVSRMNIVIKNADSFTDSDFEKYKQLLKIFAGELKEMFERKCFPELNVLTDRLKLSKMNNCGAGDSNITIAPNGEFYICPAFYHACKYDGTEVTHSDECKKGFSVGSLATGLNIKNDKLYKLANAPLCRTCDAYQCKRCIWLNRLLTLEVNTPSHEQCVIAHLEHNASHQLLLDVNELNIYPSDIIIKENNYLDPFEARQE